MVFKYGLLSAYEIITANNVLIISEHMRFRHVEKWHFEKSKVALMTEIHVAVQSTIEQKRQSYTREQKLVIAFYH